MKRHLTPGQFFSSLAIAVFLVFTGLMLVIGSMQGRIEQKDATIRQLAKEIRWQRYDADKAKSRIADYQELRYLAQVMMTKDRNVYRVARAAWMWGRWKKPTIILAAMMTDLTWDLTRQKESFSPLSAQPGRRTNERLLPCGEMRV